MSVLVAPSAGVLRPLWVVRVVPATLRPASIYRARADHSAAVPGRTAPCRRAGGAVRTRRRRRRHSPRVAALALASRPGCPFLFRGRGVAGQGANIPGMYLDRPPDGVDGDRRERAGHDEPDVSVPAGCFRGDGGQRLCGLSALDSPDLWPRRHRPRVAACPHDSCLLLSRCVTTAEGVQTAGLDQSARRRARQHPTAEQARSEHGQKIWTNRASKR